jgi:hypothetical protein
MDAPEPNQLAQLQFSSNNQSLSLLDSPYSGTFGLTGSEDAGEGDNSMDLDLGSDSPDVPCFPSLRPPYSRTARGVSRRPLARLIPSRSVVRRFAFCYFAAHAYYVS